MVKKKKGRVFYEVTGKGVLLGYTSNKIAFKKGYIRQGWKAKDLKFQKKRSKL